MSEQAKNIVEQIFNAPDTCGKIHKAYKELVETLRITSRAAIGYIAAYADLPTKLVYDVLDNPRTDHRKATYGSGFENRLRPKTYTLEELNLTEWP